VVKSVATPTFRFMTCSCILDYNTVAAADKFGNIAVVGGTTCKMPCAILMCKLSPSQIRLPQDVTDEVDEDPTGNKAVWDRGVLSGASQKVVTLAVFDFCCLCRSVRGC